MDKARTEYDRGKINNKFQQFASDYGFKVHPCITGRPRTKAKVEAPMKILDEIRAYNGKLNYRELVELVTKINNRVNSQVNQGTGRIPLLYFEKEKAFLRSLHADNVRKPYQITTNIVKVNHSSMFNYKGCQYSVQPEYVGRIVSLQIYDGLSFTEGLLKPSNYEVDFKEQSASRSMIKAAAFPFVKELKDFDFEFQPSVNEQEMRELTNLGEDSNLFFQLTDMRYEKKSTILTTNMNFNEWDGVFYDAVVANAIMDRILHHAHVIPISGKSYRLKDHLKAAD